MKYLISFLFFISISAMELQQVVVDHPTITINEIHQDCDEKRVNELSCCSSKMKVALIAGGSSVLSAGLAVLITVLSSKKCG